MSPFETCIVTLNTRQKGNYTWITTITGLEALTWTAGCRQSDLPPFHRDITSAVKRICDVAGADRGARRGSSLAGDTRQSPSCRAWVHLENLGQSAQPVPYSFAACGRHRSGLAGRHEPSGTGLLWSMLLPGTRGCLAAWPLSLTGAPPRAFPLRGRRRGSPAIPSLAREQDALPQAARWCVAFPHLWNEASERKASGRRSGWPPSPSSRLPSKSNGELSESFRGDAKAYLAMRADPDLFDERPNAPRGRSPPALSANNVTPRLAA